MAIKQYSLKKDGSRKLSPSFAVREFRCRDGSDTVLVDEGLVVLLQCIREHFGKAVTVTSGYRTAEHNNFARRVPILEEQMKVANHRIADLEENEKKGI